MKNQKKNTGFTLIEIMTSVTVFAVVMTISMGSIIGIFDANRKAESLKSVMDNLNLSVESMSREMRFGSIYHCGGAPYGSSANCLAGDHTMAFLSNDRTKTIVYRQNGSQIQKSSDGGNNFLPVTAPEITITDLTFYVLGALSNDDRQPMVLIKIKGKAGAVPKVTTDFTVQTIISQRKLDK